MIPFFEQIKYSLYFLIFGLFIGMYFDYLELFNKTLEPKLTKLFKKKIISKIMVFVIDALILAILIHISLEYTFSTTGGYAPIHMSIFFLGGYLIYRYAIKKHSDKNLFYLAYFNHKFKLKERFLRFIKNIFINHEIIKKTKQLFIKLKSKLYKKINEKKQANNENGDIIVP